jgi:hypothetical protein
MEKSKTVAVTVHQPTAGTITFTYMGGQDAASLETIAYTVIDDTRNGQLGFAGTAGTKLAVGTTTQVTGVFSGQNHAVAVGHFTDGTDQVILDTYV